MGGAHGAGVFELIDGEEKHRLLKDNTEYFAIILIVI